MQKKTAIEKYLKSWGGDGHSIIDPNSLVKMGFDQQFVEQHTQVHESDGTAKGSIFNNDGVCVNEMAGVYSLSFSYGIAKDCGADMTEARSKMGRGFQAQALRTAINDVISK